MSQKLSTISILNSSLIFITLLSLSLSNSATGADDVGTQAENTEIDYKRVEIWGPGLNSKSQLPTRYIYIQLYSLDGSR